MANIPLCIAISICFAIPELGLCAEGIDPQLKRGILAGWAELERTDDARTAVDSAWERNELDGPNKGTKQGVGRYRQNGQSALVSSHSDKIDEVARNSKYIFVVGRESDTHPWTMRFIELDLASDGAKKLQESAFLSRHVAPTSAVFLGSFISQQKKPSALSDDPKFQMIRAEAQSGGLVKLYYQYELITGESDCDPAQHYLITRGRSRETGKRVEYVMTFERHLGPISPDGQIGVKSLDIEIVGNPSSVGGHSTIKITYSYPDVSRTGELDEERFRLSAYGLPEPEGVVWEKPRRWLPYWLIGAGILVMLVTTWVLRKARRPHPAEARP